MKELLKKIKCSDVVSLRYPQQKIHPEMDIDNEDKTFKLVTKDNIEYSVDFELNEIIVLDLDDIRNCLILDGNEKASAAINLMSIMLCRYIAEEANAVNRYFVNSKKVATSPEPEQKEEENSEEQMRKIIIRKIH